jgi:hypothetical protein
MRKTPDDGHAEFIWVLRSRARKKDALDRPNPPEFNVTVSSVEKSARSPLKHRSPQFGEKHNGLAAAPAREELFRRPTAFGIAGIRSSVLPKCDFVFFGVSGTFLISDRLMGRLRLNAATRHNL